MTGEAQPRRRWRRGDAMRRFELQRALVHRVLGGSACPDTLHA
jgi:hypothetical protein